jgi:hypothetical protein
MRSFARTPGVAFALLTIIALGTGSNVTVYSFARGLVNWQETSARGTVVSVFAGDARREPGPISSEDYRSLKTESNLFEWTGAARVSQTTMLRAGQQAVVSIASVTPELARCFGLPLNLGVVLSHRLGQRERGTEAAVHGPPVRVGDVDWHVAGTAPEKLEGLYFGRAIDLWMPWSDEPAGGKSGGSSYWVLAGLRQGVSASQAQEVLDGTGKERFRLVEYTGLLPGDTDSFSRVATMMKLAAAFVFLIACVNVASFLIGRATARAHDTTLRVALGASRRQLVGELLFDSAAISVIGGALGLLLAHWTSRFIPVLLFERDAERLVFAPDGATVAAAAAISIAITVVSGLVPGFVTPYDRPADVLRRESAGPSKVTQRLRAGLAIVQMSGCCALLMWTAFLREGLRASTQPRAGLLRGHSILATMQAHPESARRHFARVEESIRSLPGVSTVAWAARPPGAQPAWQSFRIEPARLSFREVTVDIVPFRPELLPRFSLPPIAGRMFALTDHACRVALVNEEAAAVLFRNESAGRVVHDPAGRPVEIIGVVAMRRYRPGPGSRPAMYLYEDQTGPVPPVISSTRIRAPVDSRLERVELGVNVVSPAYFAALGVLPSAGRIFPDDPEQNRCRVAVVNQEAADRYFGGRALSAAVIDDDGRRTDIIGVVPEARLGVFQRRTDPAIYFPMEQNILPDMTLILGQPPSGVPMAELQKRIAGVQGRGSVPTVIRTLEQYLSQTSLAPLRIAAAIFGASAAIALLLTILGLYGALSDSARLRRRELAVRIALGAKRRHVVGQVLREGGRLAAAGALAGLCGSLLLSRWLSGVMPDSEWPHLGFWLAAPVVLALAVVVASLLPARRALMLDPLAILRQDN